jgi:O-antigen/teichoic acid export membrane protein
MSLTMISTGMLNSMGFEKQTFLYYFIGAAVMLLCILILPPVCGVYAYVIGLGASFVINGVCNLFLLHQKCPIFKKWTGHVRIHSFFNVFLCILPLSILGQFFNTIFKNYFGEFFAVTLTATILIIATFLSYAFIGILPIKALSKKHTLPSKRKA